MTTFDRKAQRSTNVAVAELRPTEKNVHVGVVSVDPVERRRRGAVRRSGLPRAAVQRRHAVRGAGRLDLQAVRPGRRPRGRHRAELELERREQPDVLEPAVRRLPRAQLRRGVLRRTSRCCRPPRTPSTPSTSRCRSRPARRTWPTPRTGSASRTTSTSTLLHRRARHGLADRPRHGRRLRDLRGWRPGPHAVHRGLGELVDRRRALRGQAGRPPGAHRRRRGRRRATRCRRSSPTARGSPRRLWVGRRPARPARPTTGCRRGTSATRPSCPRPWCCSATTSRATRSPSTASAASRP